LPFTLVAFNEDRATAQTAWTAVQAAYDEHVAREGKALVVPAANRLIGIVACHGTGTSGGSVTGVRLESPSLRRIYPIYLPIAHPTVPNPHTHTENLASAYTQNATTAEGIAFLGGIELFPTMPLTLDVNEHLEAMMTNGALTGARGLIGVWLATEAISPVTGEIRTIKATTTFTPTANEWTSSELNFEVTLPVGRYRVVGAKVVAGDTYGLFRFIFTGGVWRPGGILSRSLMEKEHYQFRRGILGNWGEFDQITPPKIEIMELTAVANPDVYLDLIKIA